jgi:UDP-GlcNAc3NAcA epimerase
MKIASVVGARPQFIKLAPLSRLLRKEHREVIVHTGQHFDDNMSQALFRDLQLPKPDYFLNIHSGLHGEQTGRMLDKVEQVIISEKPELVVVFGDTNSTLAGALAAVKLHIPVLHVEAGLRSYNRRMPEEINRVATDHVADYLFSPTESAMRILAKEGLGDRSYLTGDIMVDVLKEHADVARQRTALLEKLQVESKKYYLLTLHRPYNVDTPDTLSAIFRSLEKLDRPMVFPAHPRTQMIMETHRIAVPANCILTEPLGYLDFVCLESHALKIITDSGGIQKEAYLLKKPCITLRSETEWIETVEEGWNTLVAANDETLAEKVQAFDPDKPQTNFLGTRVAEKMMTYISDFN